MNFYLFFMMLACIMCGFYTLTQLWLICSEDSPGVEMISSYYFFWMISIAYIITYIWS